SRLIRSFLVHPFDTMLVCYALLKMELENEVEIDEKRVLQLCLLHDLLESRTGDLNYVNKKYLEIDEEKALEDMCRPLFFGDEMSALIKEFERKESCEARLAADADQLALIVLVKEQHDLGNPYATKWLAVARQRLLTESGRALGKGLFAGDWASWWFSKDSNEWWVNGKTKKGEQ
ncbi:MAG: HD domain-containing protein, partial [Deltaproteobacteria bacterium]|nr:HD domain-containing protein [Candidatus Tharpella sp.]